MALHHMVWDGATGTSKAVELTAEEETALTAQWAQEEARIKALPPHVSLEDRIKALEAKLGIVNA